MNHRKRKQSDNQKKKKRMYTPEGYVGDPPDAKCPYCGQKQKPCSYLNSLSRAWARNACFKKYNKNDE